MLPLIVSVLGHSGGRVVFTNMTWSKTTVGGATQAGIAWQPDGSVDQTGPIGSERTDTHPGEWWTKEPQAGIGSTYQIRSLTESVGNWTFAAAADNVWIDLSIERVWFRRRIAKAGPGSDVVTSVFEIRHIVSLITQDTATVSLTAIIT